MKSTLVRPASLVLALLLIPACSGDKKVSPTLFSESFNGGFPSTNWTAPVVTGSATAAADHANGFPAPSLKMSTTGATASVKTVSILSFDNPSVTVSGAMATLSGATTELGSGSVSILDATPAAVASATWNNATGLITFHINGGAALVTQAGFTADMLKIELGATFGAGTAWPSFFFDEISVTTP